MAGKIQSRVFVKSRVSLPRSRCMCVLLLIHERIDIFFSVFSPSFVYFVSVRGGLGGLGAGFVFPRARRPREMKSRIKNGGKNREHSEGSAGSDGGEQDKGVGCAAVPLSMMRRRLEEIWACAKTNNRLADVSDL